MDGLSDGDVLGINVTSNKENNANNSNDDNNNNGAYIVRSPNSTLSPQSLREVEVLYDDDEGNVINGGVETSIEQLYDNVCAMQSSDQSPSRGSYLSDDNESRIDSELRHLAGGTTREVEIVEEEVREDKGEEGLCGSGFDKKDDECGPGEKSLPVSSWIIDPVGTKSISKGKTAKRGIPLKKQRIFPLAGSDMVLDNPDLGPFLLKQARDLLSSGDNLHKALNLAMRASKSFEICANGKPSLELVKSLHVTAAIHSTLGQYNEAVPVLCRSIEIPSIEDGEDHALAKFAGSMQLGDTYSMLGQLENSISCYTKGLQIQKQVLGEKDPRVGKTCRYLAEAHLQALKFDEAENLCQMALEIHRENGLPGSLSEAADRRLMGLIHETKGDHEKALEQLVLASMAMVANGQEKEVASVDCSIGDAYLSLSRYDEAIFAYEKALITFKSSKGENHPSIASVYVRLANLYNKTGKLRESKSYCENALRIYSKPVPGTPPEDIANGFIDISAIYESMNELDQAIKLLQKALKIYDNAPGKQNTIAGIQAQMGIMYYILGNYTKSYDFFKSAIDKLRVCGEDKSAFFGIVLNQMGLCCIQLYAVNEAAKLFEEARCILEHEYGPYHPDTLGVYSNLAGSYDAIGRLDEAIEILEKVVGMREEELGTANPDVDDERRRLAELLKEAGRVRTKKGRSLESLLNANSHHVNDNGINV